MKIAKATIAVSPVTISNVITGVVRSKFTAVMLGTSGVGLFSQAFNFFSFFITLASLGMRLGVTKYIAKYSSENNDEKVAQTIAQAVVMQTAVSVAAAILIAIFARTFSSYLFASNSYALLLVVLSVGIPFVVLSGTFEAVIIGFGDYKSFTAGRVISNVAALAPLFILVWAFRIKGAFLYIVASAILSFFIFLYFMRKKVPGGILKDIKSFKFQASENHDRALGAKLLSYGGTSFVSGAIGLLCVVLSRTLLINNLGLEANGLYQVVFAISSYYLAIFTNGLWSYYYPKASAAKEPDKYAYETNQALRFCILGIVPFILVFYLSRFLIIHMLYSSKFMGSAELFPYQLFGDMFFLIFYVLGSSLLAKERLKAYIFITVVYGACFIGLFLVLCGHFGLKSMPCAYLIASFVGVVALGIYHVKRLRVDIERRNIALFVGAIALLLVIFFVPGHSLIVTSLKAILIFSFFWLFVSKEEKSKVFALVGGALRRQ